MSTPTNQFKISDTEKLNRIALALAALATEMDIRDDEYETAGIRRVPETGPRMSMEEQIERLLFAEHFLMTAIPEGGVW